jgi:hypothetical protein
VEEKAWDHAAYFKCIAELVALLVANGAGDKSKRRPLSCCIVESALAYISKKHSGDNTEWI